jgi:hypothetical protein
LIWVSCKPGRVGEVLRRNADFQVGLTCSQVASRPANHPRALSRNNSVRSGERARLACCQRRPAVGLACPLATQRLVLQPVGREFAAGRRKPHAGGMCSPLATAWTRLSRFGNRRSANDARSLVCEWGRLEIRAKVAYVQAYRPGGALQEVLAGRRQRPWPQGCVTTSHKKSDPLPGRFSRRGGRFLAVVVLHFTARCSQDRPIERRGQLGKSLALNSAGAIGCGLGTPLSQSVNKERLRLLNRSQPNP